MRHDAGLQAAACHLVAKVVKNSYAPEKELVLIGMTRVGRSVWLGGWVSTRVTEAHVPVLRLNRFLALVFPVDQHPVYTASSFVHSLLSLAWKLGFDLWIVLFLTVPEMISR